jgi:sigma-B regulation protein RsbU (phosphoserine phosphatase)
MQLEMAAEIQAGLLPRTIPDIPFLRLSHLNKPAYEVGGDYYDFFQLDPDGERFGVVIADASGKNVPAAILMTVFKTTLATMDLANLSAGKVLTQSNLILKKMGIEDRFITAMYVIFHTSASTIEVACAGHNPGLLVSGRGYERSIAEISADGVPLGIIEMEYDSKTYKIKPNDLLLLYTDGVTEARNEQGDEFGISGLKKFLARPRGKVPAQDLYEDIKAHTQQAHQHDDITAVAVEFLGKKT